MSWIKPSDAPYTSPSPPPPCPPTAPSRTPPTASRPPHLLTHPSWAFQNHVRRLELQGSRDLSKGLAPSPPSRESRRLRCRQARYERYQAVLELTRRGETQLEIAAKLGLAANTVATWQHAGEFPERRIRCDRPRDQVEAVSGEVTAGSTQPVA